MSDSAPAENEFNAQAVQDGSWPLYSGIHIPCYFLSLKLENVRAFKSRQQLSLIQPDGRPARWTVLLGDNGMGKTTVLQCLAGMRLENDLVSDGEDRFIVPVPWISREKELHERLIRVGSSRWHLETECSSNAKINEVRSDTFVVTFDSSAPNEHGYSSQASNVGTGESFVVYGYGALRRLGKGSLEDTRDLDPCATLFDDEKTLLNADEWLREADYAAAKSKDPKANERLLRIIDLLKELLPDLEDIRIEARGTKVPVPEAKTPFGWIPVRALSTGYRSVIAWVVDFASRLLDRYPDAEKPFHGSAIVLVDQIDLYLHPKWQREMMERLSRIFPNTQFIVTAHSPLIVQAAPDANIALLRRIGDEVHILNNPEDIRGWRTDQLLASELFEHQPTRDTNTEKMLAERRALLEKHPRTSEEEARLEKLEKQASAVPEAENAWEIEAMKLIRDAAENLPAK